MKKISSLLVLLLCSITFIFPVHSQEGELDEQGRLLRATPESQGIRSETITELIQALDSEITTMNSIMILRHGRVIAEAAWAPYTITTPHAMYSTSKSFTSTAAGFAVDEGLLNIDTPVMDFFPNNLPKDPSDNFKAMKVRHLLSMSCGHETEAPCKSMVDICRDLQILDGKEENWVDLFMQHPVVFEPGTHFTYNTLGTYMVGAIVEKVSNQSLVDFLQPRLFEPLQIKNVYWETSPQGINKGGTGLYINTEDMAKFGQFYLQKGKWNGQQLLSQKWIDEATSKQVSNGTDLNSDGAQGYCFQFWRCRHNIYRGDGMYCQYIVIMPDQDMVIASTADSQMYQDILNLYWKYLLPSLSDTPLNENTAAQKKFQETASKLVVHPGMSENRVVCDRKVESPSLKQTLTYSIYLPRSCRTTGTDFPVLVLLPNTGKANIWFDNDKINLPIEADQWFEDRPFDKMAIIVPSIPEGIRSEENGTVDSRWLFEELLPHINKAWRCNTDQLTIATIADSGNPNDITILRNPTPDQFELPEFIFNSNVEPDWSKLKSTLPSLFEKVIEKK